MVVEEGNALQKLSEGGSGFLQTLQCIVSNTALQQKWNSTANMWRYSYTLEETGFFNKIFFPISYSSFMYGFLFIAIFSSKNLIDLMRNFRRKISKSNLILKRLEQRWTIIYFSSLVEQDCSERLRVSGGRAIFRKRLWISASSGDISILFVFTRWTTSKFALTHFK